MTIRHLWCSNIHGRFGRELRSSSLKVGLNVGDGVRRQGLVEVHDQWRRLPRESRQEVEKPKHGSVSVRERERERERESSGVEIVGVHRTEGNQRDASAEHQSAQTTHTRELPRARWLPRAHTSQIDER